MNCDHPVCTEEAMPLRSFFRRFVTALAAVLLAGAGFPCAVAQDSSSATGAVTGRVLNLANGKYLTNARVIVEGTTLETFTNDFGDYTLRRVPVGEVRLRVFYTGQPPQSAGVTVLPDETVVRNIQFGGADTAREQGAVVLDEFTVATNRYKNASEIAISEERYSPNLKNVVAADFFGDIPDGNIGEFVKYIPGVQIDYGYSGTGLNAADNNATSISVRGFGPEMTSITIDGVPLTNASPASLTRAVGLDMMSVNNASRVEVIKVPTPDMPSNSPGGSINLVTKSAFEYAKPTFSVAVSASVNSEDVDGLFKKTPGPADKDTYKTLPGVEFSYVLPINDKMGLTVTGAWSRTFNENHQAKSDWLYNTKDLSGGSSFTFDLRPGGGPLVQSTQGQIITPLSSVDGDQLDLTNPALWRYQVTDTPNTVTRTSGSLRFDWRPTSSQRIAVGYTLGLFDSVDAQRRLQFYGNRAYLMDWGPDFTTSYRYQPGFDPGATVNQSVTTRDRTGNTHTGYINYVFQKGPWSIDANINGSRSRGSYQDAENGHFSEIETNLTLGQFFFKDIREGMPGQIELYDRDGNRVDWTDLSKWNAPSISAKSGETESKDENTNFKLNVRRDLDFLPWDWISVSAKAGFYREQKRQKKWGLGTGYRMSYYGPVLALGDYMDDGYSGISPGFGLPGQQWISTYKLYELWQDNPSYFNADSDADRGNNYQSWANQQKSITETSDQYYFMLDGKTLKNRLNWVAGVRQEIAKREGYATKQDNQWNYVKNKDGTLYRDASHPNGVRIDQAGSDVFATTPAGEALRGTFNSMGLSYPAMPISSSATGGTFYEYSKLRWIPFSNIDGKVTGKPTYMASGAYSITENLIARLSWNRSQARPDFENGVLAAEGQSRGLTISENPDPSASPRGTITISNANLQPWVADGWDLQLAYYTPSGGKFAVTPYYKSTKNFHETVAIASSHPDFEATLAAYGLDPSLYEDYEITTTVNGSGTAQTLGYELEVVQNLGVLGRWGKYFQVFGSYSHHYVKQERTNKLTAKPLAGTTASGGLTFATKRFSLLARALYLEERFLGSETTYLYQGNQYVVASYNPSSIQLDLNADLKLSEHYSLFINTRNILNRSRDTLRYDQTGLIPSYAHNVERKEFGVTWYFGIKGTW